MKRFLTGMATLFVFLTILFFVFQIIIPGDYSQQFGREMPSMEAARAMSNIRTYLGVGEPLLKQYALWILRLLQGDLGISFSGYPVWDFLKNLLPATLLIFLTGLYAAFFLGQSLAVLSLKSKSRFTSEFATFLALLFYTSFPPWLAFLVILTFSGVITAIKTKIYSTNQAALSSLWDASQQAPGDIMLIMLGCFILCAIFFFILIKLTEKKIKRHIVRIIPILFSIALSIGLLILIGYGMESFGVLRSGLYPFITFLLISTGETMLIFRNNMLEVKHENYVLFARATGEKPDEVVRRHITRNSILPVLSNAVNNLPYLMTGVVIIEKATHWKGLGEATYYAFMNKDTPLVMGILVIIGLVSFLFRFLLDLAQLFIDPRLRAYNDQSHIEQ
jgi:ABC-type dipeptide/oligopeptide/nickel transport system permease component